MFDLTEEDWNLVNNHTFITPRFRWYSKFVFDEIVPVTHGHVYDRTESVDLGIWKQKVVTPIPEFRVYTDTYESAVADRAIALAKEAKDKNRQIAITLSGGLDSSTVVSAFLMYTDAEIWVSRSPSAVEEWPEFFKYLEDHPRVTRFLDFDYIPFLFIEYYSNDIMWVSGDPGDIVFGSKMYRPDQKMYANDGSGLLPFYDSELWEAPWQGIPNSHREFYEPIVSHCPMPIENNYDLTWWLGFCMKWQLCEARLHRTAHLTVPNLKSFYSSDLIQLWSMNNNHAVKCPDKRFPENLKYETKKLIYKFFPNETVWSQVKRDSLAPVLGDITKTFKEEGSYVVGRAPTTLFYHDENWKYDGVLDYGVTYVNPTIALYYLRPENQHRISPFIKNMLLTTQKNKIKMEYILQKKNAVKKGENS